VIPGRRTKLNVESVSVSKLFSFELSNLPVAKLLEIRVFDDLPARKWLDLSLAELLALIPVCGGYNSTLDGDQAAQNG
jgi:hypothetical protein